MIAMSFDPQLILGLIFIIAAVLLISERIRPDLLALCILVVLGISGLVHGPELFAGFSGSAVITLIGISILSRGLYQTGIARGLGNWLHHFSRGSEKRLMVGIILSAALFSLFMNNIAVVGVLLPAALVLSRKAHIPASRILIPLAYGTTLGGMATLLTTANLILSGTLRDAGFAGFKMTDFLPIGIPLVIMGTIYIVLVGRKQLPQTTKGPLPGQLPDRLAELYELRSDLGQVEILTESRFANQTIQQADWQKNCGLNILALTRGQTTIAAPDGNQLLLPGDLLLVEGPIETNLNNWGLRPVASQENLPLTSESVTLGELVISPHAAILGKTLCEVEFRRKFGLNVLAIWHEGRPVRSNITSLPLRPGDALLVQGAWDKITDLSSDPNIMLLEEDEDAVRNPRKILTAVLITSAVVLTAVLNWAPISLASICGAVLMVLTGCIGMDDLYQSIEWKAIFLIAGMWPLSSALISTGLAQTIVTFLGGWIGPFTPLGITALLIALAALLAQFVSGQVAAISLAPLALAAAAQTNGDPHTILLGVALGCSLTFSTPTAHPTNIMVMSPGGYQFRDYLRMGLPLTILCYILILLGLRIFFGL